MVRRRPAEQAHIAFGAAPQECDAVMPGVHGLDQRRALLRHLIPKGIRRAARGQRRRQRGQARAVERRRGRTLFRKGQAFRHGPAEQALALRANGVEAILRRHQHQGSGRLFAVAQPAYVLPGAVQKIQGHAGFGGPGAREELSLL
jgi:hypothetical protein